MPVGKQWEVPIAIAPGAVSAETGLVGPALGSGVRPSPKDLCAA
jgi:hypothetical protein